MTHLIDYIGENYGGLLSLISLPITLILYLKEVKSKESKALEEISDKIIDLIVKNEKIALEDVDRIRTYVLNKHKVRGRKISNRWILDFILMKIEESPFVTTSKMSVYKERVIKIEPTLFRSFHRSKKFNISIYNKILGYLTLILSISYILSKEQIDLASQLGFVGYVLLGIITIILALAFYMLIIFYIGINQLQGKYRVDNDSLKSLKLSRYKKLVATTSNDGSDYVFHIGKIKSDTIRRCVDTYPGLYGEFLMTRIFQDHEKFSFNLYCSDLNLKIEYLLQKESVVNGSEKFDVLHISLIKCVNVLVVFKKCIKSDDEKLIENGIKYFNNYSMTSFKSDNLKSRKDTMSVNKEGNSIEVDQDYFIVRFEINKVKFLVNKIS